VAGSCEYGDELAGSGATELEYIYLFFYNYQNKLRLFPEIALITYLGTEDLCLICGRD
jgi:hypothetical protein